MPILVYGSCFGKGKKNGELRYFMSTTGFCSGTREKQMLLRS